jgi:hypothetical protein
MQASDLLSLQDPAQNYASAYLAWIDAVLARAASTDATIARQAWMSFGARSPSIQ